MYCTNSFILTPVTIKVLLEIERSGAFHWLIKVQKYGSKCLSDDIRFIKSDYIANNSNVTPK